MPENYYKFQPDFGLWPLHLYSRRPILMRAQYAPTQWRKQDMAYHVDTDYASRASTLSSTQYGTTLTESPTRSPNWKQRLIHRVHCAAARLCSKNGAIR
jgi:hypothetical protein